MRSRKRHIYNRIKLWKAALCIACIITVACGAVLLGASVYFKNRATPSPAPNLSVSDTVLPYDEQGFPYVDWDYWKRVNPDIIGWVTVPGTSVDLPIVQAHISNSAFYLTHDIYKEWNYMGCPYLDAECKRMGLDSRCAMIYGHNSADGSIFADFANYNNKDFAEEHSDILLQTPSEKRRLKVIAISIIKGDDVNNKLQFENATEFNTWYKDRIKNSFFQLGSMEGADKSAPENNSAPSSVVAFCTCSYNFWPDNERTVVYAIQNHAAESIA